METREAAMSHVGTCFCGEVTVEVSGEPEGMGYCHCSSCRSWSGGPVNAFSLWKPENVRVTRGAENVATFNKTAFSFRKYCANLSVGMVAAKMSTRPMVGWSVIR